MMNKEVFEMVKEVILEYFDDDEIRITENTVASDVDEWDSLAQISILTVLEERFKIKFSITDSQQMKCVGDMANIIADLINKEN